MQDNPRRVINGYIVERLPDGTLKTIGPANAQQQPVTIGTPDPRVEVGIQDTQADNARADRQLERQLANDAANRNLAERRVRLAEQSAAREADTGGGLTAAQKRVDAEFAKQYAEMQAAGGIADLRKQLGQLKEAQRMLDSSDTITGPMIGRLPEWMQQSINPDAVNVREQVEEVVQRNLRLILGAQFTEKEGERLISRAFNPRQQEGENSKRVARVIEQMATAIDARESATKYYEANGTLAGWSAPTGPTEANRPTAWQKNRIVAGDPVHAAMQGDTKQSIPIPAGYQQAYSAGLREILARNGGRIDPDAYVRLRADLDTQYADYFERNGITLNPAQSAADHREWVAEVNASLDRGGAEIKEQIPGIEKELSAIDDLRNSAVNNPVGAFLTNSADMTTMGAGTAMFGDQMAAVQADNPISSTLGQIGGAVAGTGLVGGGFRLGAKAVAPNAFKRASQALQGSRAGRVGANLAEDVAYSAGYGQVTEGDAATGAALGGAGSLLGQGVGKVLGKAIGGGRPVEAAQTLNARGVPTTVGQNLGGGFSKVEDAMMSLPVVGDKVAARRMEGMTAFNRAAFDEAGAPVGMNPNAIAEQGIEDLQGRIVPQAYGDALNGRQFVADEQFEQAIRGRLGEAGALPPSVSNDTIYAMQRPLNEQISEEGVMTGQGFQRAYQDLQGRQSAFRRNTTNPNMGDAANVLGGVTDDLTGMVQRQAPDALPAFRNANQTYGRSQVLQNAVDKAKNTEGIFTPAQLNMASSQSGRRYGRTQGTTQRPFYELGRAGQEVLPSSLPDSGTPYRQILTQSGIGLGGAGGLGYLAGGTEGAGTAAGTTASAAALLTALGTRRGQQVVNSALFARPEQLRRAAEILRENNRLAGKAALPFAIAQ